MASNGVRKRKGMSLEQKVAIIEEVEKKQKSQAQVSKEYGVPPGSIYTIMKDKTKILTAYETGEFSTGRKRMRRSDTDPLDRALWIWFKEARSHSVPISGLMLMEKAMEMAYGLGIPDFKGSTGWLDRFKTRHGIATVCGELASVCQESTDLWEENYLKSLINEYEPDDIFSAGETGLFYKRLPTRTGAMKGEKSSGDKIPKDRITLLVAANMSGSEKLPLLIIGKFSKPRCLKNVVTLPADYKANSKAWMTGALFEEWIRKLDRKFLLQGRSIVLIVDNCPEHLHVTELRAIKLVFLPPNTTSILLPCDQGIIQALKVHYRKRVLKKVIASIDMHGDGKCYQKMTVLDAMTTAAAAWNDVKPETIANCFRHAGFIEKDDDTLVTTEDMSTATAISECSNLFDKFKSLSFQTIHSTVEDFIHCDEEVPTSAALTDRDIISSVEQDSEAGEDEETDDSDAVPLVSTKTALSALTSLRHFCLQQPNSSEFLHQLNNLENFVQGIAARSIRQTKINSFFKTKE